MKNEKRKSRRTTRTAQIEKRRRADLVSVPKNPQLINTGEGDGRLKTITDIPNDVLATILEYLLPDYSQFRSLLN